MISTFNDMDGNYVKSTTMFNCALPLGSLIRSPTQLADPNPLKSLLQVVAIYPDTKTGNIAYSVSPAA